MRSFGTEILTDHIPDKNTIFLKHLGAIKPSSKFISYLVALKYYEGDNDVASKRLDYTIGIEYLNEDSQELPHIFRLHKKELFFNRKKPSLIIEEIAAALSTAIYPLEISVDHTGKFISIVNHDQIKKRWPIVKKKILKEYRGETTFKIIKRFEETIKNDTKLEASLHNEIFFSLFYQPFYMGHNKELKENSKIFFPIEPYKGSVIFSGETTINPFIADDSAIQLRYVGMSILPDISRLHVKRKGHLLISDLQIDYDLDQNTYMPNFIDTTCTIYDKTKKEEIKAIELMVTRIEDDKHTKSSFEQQQNKAPNTIKVKPKKRDWFYGFKKKNV
jgi:hypothetical protein